MKRLLLISILLIVFGSAWGIWKVRAYVIQTTLQTTYAKQEPYRKKLWAYYHKVFDRSSVYEFLRRAYYMFGIPKKGLIHIGARNAEELGYYIEHDVENILWIEADLEAEANLKRATEKHPGSKIAMFAVGDANGTIVLHKTSNGGDSSSILPLKKHLAYYPGITETKQLIVPQKRLDDYLSEKEKRQYNVIVIDIQGAELIALKGSVETLKVIDAIIAETNYDLLYENAVLIHELDDFLRSKGFTRVDSISAAFYTGDALYIKNKFLKARSG